MTQETEMTETKNIDPAALASITTGVLLTEFLPVHEAAEWLLGHPIWTHELPRQADPMKAAALAQFPDMPTETGESWEICRDAVRAVYGDTVAVARGSQVRSQSPIETARQAFGASA